MVFIEIEEETNFVKFEKEGDEVIGVLLEVKKSSTYKDTNVYTMKLQSAKINGELLDITAVRFPEKVCRIFGSVVLDQKMMTVKDKSKIQIIFLGATIKTQTGTAKNYKVLVDDGK